MYLSGGPGSFRDIVESEQDVLQNVLSVARVGDTPANEVAQPGLLLLDYFGGTKNKLLRVLQIEFLG